MIKLKYYSIFKINGTLKENLPSQTAFVPSSSSSPNNKVPKNICTVEELERGLLKSRQQNQTNNRPPTNNLNQPPYLFQVIYGNINHPF